MEISTFQKRALKRAGAFGGWRPDSVPARKRAFGLCEMGLLREVSPGRYDITDMGRAALKAKEGK